MTTPRWTHSPARQEAADGTRPRVNYRDAVRKLCKMPRQREYLAAVGWRIPRHGTASGGSLESGQGQSDLWRLPFPVDTVTSEPQRPKYLIPELHKV